MILPYLLKSTLCLGILFSFYKVALEHKAMHQFKRYYLLASLIFAFTIPLITFTYTADAIPEPAQLVNTSTYYSNTMISQVPSQETAEKSLLPIVLWSLYVSGILIFGTRFVINLVRLKRKINASEQFPKDEFTLSLLGKSVVPHSFLKWIFLNKAAYLNQKIAPEVLAHEATHVRQKHSWDILFVELLQIFFWFNPLIWLSQKSIKLNHEFLADQGAIDNKSNIAIYQNILLSYASSTDHTALESPFNYSLTKKRILMLSQTFSRKRAALSALLLIPILGLCTFLFNNEIKAQSELINYDKTYPIEGHWIDHGNENTNVFIYIKNDTLWWKQQAQIVPIEIVNSRFFLPAGEDKIELSLSNNGFLKMGESVYFTPPEDTISYRIDGVWQGEDDTITYLFNTKNGSPTCDVTNLETNSTTRFYPKLIDHGMTFTIGDKWLRFELEGSKLIMQDGGILTRIRNNSVYVLEDKRNIPYAQEFIKGAIANDIKPLVIEVRNNKIKINGKTSSLATFTKDIDAITKDWEETDYTSPARSYIFEGNTPEFLKKLEEEYAKTHISKANDGAKLVPPPPPPPPAPQSLEDLPAPPPPPSVEDHLFKMNRLGGEFYYNDTKITYAKAQKLIEDYEDLNVKTPYPYSTPPKTFISKELIDKVNTQKPVTKKEIAIYNKLAIKYNKDPEGIIKQGEVIRMYDIYSRMTPKQKKNAQPYPVLPPPPPPTPPVKEKNVGNKKASPDKKSARKTKLASSGDVIGLKEASPPKMSKKKGGYSIDVQEFEDREQVEFFTEMIEKHAQKGGVFELEGKFISEQEALETLKYPYIGAQKDHLSTPQKLTIIKDPVTSIFDVFYQGRLLSESEFHKISSNADLKLKKVKSKTDTNKAIYRLGK